MGQRTRDTHIIYHCLHCGWQDKARARPWGVRTDKCDGCRRHGINFVTFEAGAEDDQARQLLGRPFEYAEGEGPDEGD